jgi:hypothetical protein
MKRDITEEAIRFNGLFGGSTVVMTAP